METYIRNTGIEVSEYIKEEALGLLCTISHDKFESFFSHIGLLILHFPAFSLLFLGSLLFTVAVFVTSTDIK